MRTPSLARRVTIGGLLAFTALTAFSITVLVLATRGQVSQSLDEVLEARMALAVHLHATEGSQDLAAQLWAAGVPARVTPPAAATEAATPAPSPERPPLLWRSEEHISRSLDLEDGTRVEIFVTRMGVDEAVGDVLTAALLAAGLAFLVGLVVFPWATTRALTPLTVVVDAARRRAAGATDERLEPDSPDTDLGRVAAAFDDMLDTVDDALRSAWEAEARTRRFLDDAAHQLGSPIAGIRGSIEALAWTDEAAARERLLTNATAETARASRLLRSLLRLARLDAAQVLERRPTDLAALCDEEIARTRALADGLQVRRHLDGDDLTPALDGDAVREAVANLLDNARRHARSDIEVTVARDGDGVVIRVADDGPGPSPEVAARMFERFASGDGRGGVGLGLPIAREVARHHGGDLTFDGEAFVLRLRAEEPAAPAEPAPEVALPSPSGSTRRSAQTWASNDERNPRSRMSSA